MNTSALTASIVTYNTPVDELTTCLESLLRDNVEKVYIVDNSPTDKISDLLSQPKFRGKTEYIPNPSNPGYGAAHNIALRKAIAAGATFHLVINSDVYFPEGTLPRITEVMMALPDVGQLQPRIISTDGSDQYSARLIPTPLDLLGRRFLPSFLIRRRNNRYILRDRQPGHALNIPYHQGSFMFLRTEALQRIGLFDERFFMYPEDIDLSRRIHREYRTLYWPEVTVTHAHRAASYHSLKMLRIHMINMVRYFNKWGWFFDSERRSFNRRILAEIRQR